MTEVENIVKLLLEADEDEADDIDLVKDVAGEASPTRDFFVEKASSFYIIRPQNEQASEWLHSVSSENSTWIGQGETAAIVVEPRYLVSFVESIHQAGWKTNVEISYDEALNEEDDEDEETIKDILGPDYLEFTPQELPQPGTVERFDRWANITIGDKNFCISYLTPVAVYIPGQGVLINDRGWSKTTKRHIVKWANHIGVGPSGGFERWAEVDKQYPKVPQQDLINMFKEESSRVKWTKRQAKHATTFRTPAFWKGGSEDRVSVDPSSKESLSAIRKCVDLLLEDEDDEDFDVKELVDPGEEIEAGPTTVKRYGRMKLVDMPRYTFLISFLTPVAYYDRAFNTYYQTTKHWSPTTNKHISRWQTMIWKSPEWQANPRNQEPSEYQGGGSYVRYPRFKRKTQEAITGLFRALIPSMVIKPHMKRRMYHVDPRMRQGSPITKRWLSGHLKHHETGEEGLPKPGESGFEEFFTDFEADEPEVWQWGSDLRDLHPYERYKPDEE